MGLRLTCGCSIPSVVVVATLPESATEPSLLRVSAAESTTMSSVRSKISGESLWSAIWFVDDFLLPFLAAMLRSFDTNSFSSVFRRFEGVVGSIIFRRLSTSRLVRQPLLNFCQFFAFSSIFASSNGLDIRPHCCFHPMPEKLLSIKLSETEFSSLIWVPITIGTHND